MSRWFVGSSRAQECLGGDQHLGERKTRALAAGEDSDAFFDIVAGEEEGAKQAALLRNGPGGGDRVDLLKDGVALFEPLELMLGVIRHAHMGAERTRASGWGLLPYEHLEKRRLARSVWAHQGHTVTAVQREVCILIKDLVAVALGEVLKLDNHIAGARRIGELEVHVLVASGRMTSSLLICSMRRMRSCACAALVGL